MVYYHHNELFRKVFYIIFTKRWNNILKKYLFFSVLWSRYGLWILRYADKVIAELNKEKNEFVNEIR